MFQPGNTYAKGLRSHCRKGHALEGDNILILSTKDRVKRTCRYCYNRNIRLRYAKDGVFRERKKARVKRYVQNFKATMGFWPSIQYPKEKNVTGAVYGHGDR